MSTTTLVLRFSRTMCPPMSTLAQSGGGGGKRRSRSSGQGCRRFWRPGGSEPRRTSCFPTPEADDLSWRVRAVGYRGVRHTIRERHDHDLRNNARPGHHPRYVCCGPFHARSHVPGLGRDCQRAGRLRPRRQSDSARSTKRIEASCSVALISA